MSKTERDLSSESDVDALDEMFSDEDFESAFDDAIDHADLELGVSKLGALEESESESEVLGTGSDPDDADDDHTVIVVHAADDLDVADLDVADLDGDNDNDLETAAAEPELIDVDAHDVGVGIDRDDDADGYVLPEIVPATEEPEALTRVGDPDLLPDTDHDTDHDDDSDHISEDILEELRRADIDGPFVPHAPQDDTTTAVRRPRRAADYDPAPVPIPAKVPRVLGRKPRVRKVTRVVRHVDPWSVFKIAIIANMVLYVIVLTASVLLWNVANATGTVDNIERFFESFGWNSFEFNGGELYHAGWIAGLFGVIGMTGLAVLAATLFNLITDLVGGVRFTVLEEEVLETRSSPMRRFVVRRPEPEVPALLHDSSGAMYREAVVDDSGANHRPTR